ncbi:MAG: glycosyltransferase family 39 protein [Anaerolineae bacterium]|nr:glycosyltransferase family 39 protein [Anaerolineae bacterium]
MSLLRAQRRSLVYVGLLVLVLLLYAWAVLRGLDFFVWHDDEPVLVLTARALMQGNDLYRDVWHNYLPAFAYYLRLWFAVLGYSLRTARLASLAAGLVSLGAVLSLGRALKSRWSGLAAVVFLCTAPHFVALSSAALAEVPMSALLALGVLGSLRYVETRRRAWLMASGAAIGLAIGFKPTALPGALVPLAAVFAVERSWRRRLRTLGILGLAGSAPVLTLVLSSHPADFARQFLTTWRNSRNAFPYEPCENLGQIEEYFRLDEYGLSHVGLLVLGIVGWLDLQRRRLALAWLYLVWLGGMGLALLLHTPLYRHHLLALLYPVCVLAGFGLAEVVEWLGSSARAGSSADERRQTDERQRANVRHRVACLLIAWAVLETRSALWTSLTALRQIEADRFGLSRAAVAQIIATSSPEDYVLTDGPILAIRAQRPVPPETINTSRMRVLTGELTRDDLLQVVAQYEPVLIVFWERKLEAVPGFSEWVAEHYDLLQAWDERHRLYVRRGGS